MPLNLVYFRQHLFPYLIQDIILKREENYKELKKSQEKINNPSLTLKVIFWTLAVVFILIVGLVYFMVFPIFGPHWGVHFMNASVIIFFLLGIALIFLSIKEKMDKLLKKFLILTGTSAIGFFSVSFCTNL